MTDAKSCGLQVAMHAQLPLFLVSSLLAPTPPLQDKKAGAAHVLVMIELFRYILRLRRYSEYRLEIAVFEGGGSLCSKFPGRRGHPPPTIFRVAKTDASTFHVV